METETWVCVGLAVALSYVIGWCVGHGYIALDRE